MRITERHLRKVIRQVIKEGFGDGDMTSMSDMERNSRIEKQSQYDSSIMQRQRAGQARKLEEDLQKIKSEICEALKSADVQSALTSIKPYEAAVDSSFDKNDSIDPFQVKMGYEYDPDYQITTFIRGDIIKVFKELGIMIDCFEDDVSEKYDHCCDLLDEIIFDACQTLKNSTGGSYDRHGYNDVHLHDPSICWSSNGGDVVVWNPEILFPAIARACR